MGILSDLEPERVFYYFEEICKIPHGSYHEKAISDYLVSFAKEHGFQVYQDKLYNVVMQIGASEGYENEEPLILQGHMDMVCEKAADASIDMEHEGILLATDGEYVYAKDTTLGGDDGIAIAYMLAIAESSEIAHPPLEYIITVSEEVGMEGANEIDLSMLKGHRMLNLDSEEEGIFLSSCAGGMSTQITLPVKRIQSEPKAWYKVAVKGLLGGHSGHEIDKGRANANKILGRVLYELKKKTILYLYSMEGGKKDNAIPLRAEAQIGINKDEFEKVYETVAELNTVLKAEYAKSDSGIEITLQRIEEKGGQMVLDEISLANVISLLMTLPDGIQGMSMSVEGLVETSLNLGIMKLNAEHLFLAKMQSEAV